jgi:hypothetical protein
VVDEEARGDVFLRAPLFHWPYFVKGKHSASYLVFKEPVTMFRQNVTAHSSVAPLASVRITIYTVRFGNTFYINWIFFDIQLTTKTERIFKDSSVTTESCTICTGRAIRQAVDHRSLTAKNWFRFHASACEICGGQRGISLSFCRNFSVFPCDYHSTSATYSYIWRLLASLWSWQLTAFINNTNVISPTECNYGFYVIRRLFL